MEGKNKAKCRAIFIRHGQSTGNAGIPCHDLALLELTELGWRQASEVAASWTETPDLIVTSPYLRTQQTAAPTIERFPEELAASWTETPDLIVTSPYLRTQQTAAPTIERFPEVLVDVWPIQEFTYLQPSRWNGTLSVERMPVIERYWADADPEFCDGEGAESFRALLGRAQSALDRLKALPAESLVYVFSHGQFIQAVRSLAIDVALSETEKMRKFWGKESPAIANAEQVELRWNAGAWRHLPTSVSIA